MGGLNPVQNMCPPPPPQVLCLCAKPSRLLCIMCVVYVLVVSASSVGLHLFLFFLPSHLHNVYKIEYMYVYT